MNNHCNPLFIGHGSPMNAIETNSYTRFLNNYGKTHDKPAVVVVISAHWQTRGTWITGSKNPPQIYDFGGFPRELRELVYRPGGSPELAERIASIVPEISVEYNRGIDHGAWSILKNLYPLADVPVIQISLDLNHSPKDQFELGKKLARFCDENVLFIGSGNVIHNLRDISFDTNAEPFFWAVEQDCWFKEKIESFAIDDLINYRQTLPDFPRAVPTEEHLLPLFTILGMKGENQSVKTLFEEIQNGSVAMRSLEIG